MPKNLDMNVSDENVALPSDVADGHAYKMAKNGDIVVGTATIYNNTRISIDPGDDYKLPKGFYNDDNIISVKSIADSTSGDAKAEDIAKNKVAWVNGQKIVGTATAFSSNLKKSTAEPDDIKLNKIAYDSNGNQIVSNVRTFDYYEGYGKIAPFPPEPGEKRDGAIMGKYGTVYTPNYIYKGRVDSIYLYNGFYDDCSIVFPYFGNLTVNPEDVVKGKVFFSKKSVPGETDVYEIYEGTGTLDINEKVKEKIKADGTTVTAADMLSTKKGYDKDGNLVSGTIPDVTNRNNVVIGDSNPSYTIPKGYHDGTGKVVYNPSTTETTTATSDDILYGKTALSSNGDLITGMIQARDNEEIWMTYPLYTADNTYFRHLAIHNYAQEQINQISDISDEYIPSGEKYIGRDSSVRTGTMPIISPTEVLINGKNNTYTIPKGYHSGTGTVKLKLEFPDNYDKDTFKSDQKDIPNDVIYFNNDGKHKYGILRLASYDPIYTYRDWSYDPSMAGFIFKLSDNPIGNRLISFDNRGNSEFITDITKLRSLDQDEKASDNIFTQYNIDNNEQGYTVLAIASALHLWSYTVKSFNPSHYTRPKAFGSVISNFLGGSGNDRFMDIDYRYRLSGVYPLNGKNSTWFQTYIHNMKDSEKDIIIDDIVVDFNRSDSSFRGISGVNGMPTDINVPYFRISFPYKAIEYPTEEDLKRCCNNTRVQFDGLDYTNSGDYGNYKIYGVCSPIKSMRYGYDRNNAGEFLYHLHGNNFSITFHVYNKKKKNYTYERDPEFKNDYVMQQLGFTNNSSVAGTKQIPISIKLNNIHVNDTFTD